MKTRANAKVGANQTRSLGQDGLSLLWRALAALLFGCTSMLRDLLHVLSLPLGTESQGPKAASATHVPATRATRVGPGKTAKDVLLPPLSASDWLHHPWTAWAQSIHDQLMALFLHATTTQWKLLNCCLLLGDKGSSFLPFASEFQPNSELGRRMSLAEG